MWLRVSIVNFIYMHFGRALITQLFLHACIQGRLRFHAVYWVSTDFR